MLVARFDGGCYPNPGGDASCACLITRDGAEVYRHAEYLGVGVGQTNNVSEYRGLLLVLNWLELNPEQCMIISDSQVVIRRMSGKSGKAPVGVCAELAKKCLARLGELNPRPSFRWESRENNDECDAMCDFMIADGRQTRLI